VAFGILKDRSSGLKPLLQEDRHLVGAALAATFCATEEGRPGIGGSGFIRHHRAIEGRKFGAEAPPTGRSAFGRSGFRRDPCATEEGRPGIGGGGFIRHHRAIEGRKFGAKAPPTENRHLVGAAFAATFCATEEGRPGIGGSGFIRDHWAIEGGEFGAKAPPTKRGRSPAVADLRRHRRA
jgi:hypothetical protein